MLSFTFWLQFVIFMTKPHEYLYVIILMFHYLSNTHRKRTANTCSIRCKFNHHPIATVFLCTVYYYIDIIIKSSTRWTVLVSWYVHTLLTMLYARGSPINIFEKSEISRSQPNYEHFMLTSHNPIVLSITCRR